jgi:hypothetical protein
MTAKLARSDGEIFSHAAMMKAAVASASGIVTSVTPQANRDTHFGLI